jgi:hypothetical protein
VSIEQAGPPRFMRAGTKKIITGKAAADWRREAEAAAGEGRRDGSAEAAAVGHVPGRRHPANEIKQRTNASKTEQAERAEPPLEPTLQRKRPTFCASAWPRLACRATGYPMRNWAAPFATARALYSSG